MNGVNESVKEAEHPMSQDPSRQSGTREAADSTILITRRNVLNSVAVSGLPVITKSIGMTGMSTRQQSGYQETSTGYGNGGYGMGPYGGAEPGKQDEVITRFDSNNDNQIGFTEVLSGISAFNSGEEVSGEPVTFQDMLQLISVFNSQGDDTD